MWNESRTRVQLALRVGALAVALLAAPAAASYVATFDAQSGLLRVTFGPGNDIVRFSFDSASQDLLRVQEDPANIMQPGPYLLVNGGSTVAFSAVQEFVLDLGAGNDKLLEPLCPVPRLTIYAGPGDDVIKTPIGTRVAFVYGGEGNDTLNAEHSFTNFVYGEAGDDVMWGSSDGPNRLEGGPGDNSSYTFPNTWDRSSIQTVVHQEGAHDRHADLGSPTVYEFVASGEAPTPGGSMSILELQASQDVLDLRGWHRQVADIDLGLTSPQVVSTDLSARSLLTLTLPSGGIETVLAAPPLPEVSLMRGQDAAEPATPGSVVLNRAGSTAEPLTVNLAVSGTASSGADYLPLPAQVTVPAGASSVTLTLTPVDDQLVEGLEVVTASLGPGVSYRAGVPSTATIALADDDAPDAGSVTDAGSEARDAGSPTLDGGETAPDAGSEVRDAGSPTLDGGETTPDAGSEARDAGSPTPDGGETAPDAGAGSSDGGEPPGAPGPEAGAFQSAVAEADPVQGSCACASGGVDSLLALAALALLRSGRRERSAL